MWGLIIEAGLLGLDLLYHRWTDNTPPPPPPARYISVPRVDAGAPYPILHGRCRVRAPIIAWAGNPATSGGGASPYIYSLDQFIVLGIPFPNGTGSPNSAGSGSTLSGIHRMWGGDTEWLLSTGDRSGAGGLLAPVGVSSNRLVDAIRSSGGQLEYLDGRTTQTLVDPSTFVATTWAGTKMLYAGIGGSGIPGYRNKACILLFGSATVSWLLDLGTQVPAYSFEMSTFPASPLGPAAYIDGGTGYDYDANPADVISDILTGPVGKLGLPASRIDSTSFKAAASTLASEKHGFSRSWEGGQTAGAMIQEVLTQIDAVLYENPTTALICLKLIRPDYDPSSLPMITTGNAVRLDNVQMGGWTDVPNKIRVTFPNRTDSYKDGSATAQNQANAAGQDGVTREVQLQMPGCCTQSLAGAIVARELAARSSPMLKCSAIVDRSWYTAVPGDVLRLTWPEYGISNVVMRVANVSRGTLTGGQVKLDLIQDFYYVWRNQLPSPVVPAPIKTPGAFSR